MVGRPGRSGWLFIKIILWVFLIINSSQWAAASEISHLQQLHGRPDPGATAEPAHLLQQLHPGTPGTLYTATKPELLSDVLTSPPFFSSAALRIQFGAAQCRPKTL